jgi:hypothetical protein
MTLSSTPTFAEFLVQATGEVQGPIAYQARLATTEELLEHFTATARVGESMLVAVVIDPHEQRGLDYEIEDRSVSLTTNPYRLCELNRF